VIRYPHRGGHPEQSFDRIRQQGHKRKLIFDALAALDQSFSRRYVDRPALPCLAARLCQVGGSSRLLKETRQ